MIRRFESYQIHMKIYTLLRYLLYEVSDIIMIKYPKKKIDPVSLKTNPNAGSKQYN